MIIAPNEYETNAGFKKMDSFEKNINKIDVDYDIEDATFTGYLFKTNTLQFNVVRRSAYGKGTSYIPTSGMCFIKCINYFTKKDYTKDF